MQERKLKRRDFLKLGLATSFAFLSNSSPDLLRKVEAFGGPSGSYCFQTGFWTLDNVPIPSNREQTANFNSEYKRLGGVATLGYPISSPYEMNGFFYQAFQRGLLQWRSDYYPQQAVLANVLDHLHDAGFDDKLEQIGIPRQFTGDDGSAGDFQKAKEIRLSWLEDSDIKAAYFRNPNPSLISYWNPIDFYGLPTSKPVRLGPFTSLRCQRYVFQKWEENIQGMPPKGSVVGVLTGSLMRDFGLLPYRSTLAEDPYRPEQTIGETAIQMLNEERSKHGLAPLSYSPFLEKAAIIRAGYNAEVDLVTHTDANNVVLIDKVLKELGRPGISWGEVAAGRNPIGEKDLVYAAIKGILESPPHRGIVLSSEHCLAGFAGKRSYGRTGWWHFIGVLGNRD